MNNTIQRIYSCLEDPDNWSEVLAAISTELNSTHAFLAAKLDQQSAPFAFFEFGFEDNYFAKYQQYFFKVDLWTQGLMQNSLGEFHASHEVCDDIVFLNSEIYQDFTRPANIRHSIGCLTPQTRSGTTLELAFMSDHKQPHYSRQQVQTANGYLPHILHALSMSERINAGSGVATHTTSALDGLVSAVILCDAEGRTLHWNLAADTLLEHSLLLSKESDRQLAFNNKHYQDTLRHHMQEAVLYSGKQAPQFYVESLNIQYRVSVRHWVHKSMTPWGYAESPALMILIDPCAINSDMPRQLIQQYFSLTITEAEITRRLCLGQATQEIAGYRNVSPNTINQQIKGILSKTQTRNQTDLVSLVLRTLLTL